MNTNLQNKLTILLIMSFLALNATIIHTDNVNETLQPNGTIEIDFNGGGAEFIIEDNAFFSPPVEPKIMFNQYAGFIMAQGTWDEIAGLSINTSVNNSSNFYNLTESNDRDGFFTPDFPSGDTYVGVTFKITENTHYGWILVNWDGSSFIVKSYAYENTPNTTIYTGDVGTANVNQLNTLNTSIYPNPFVDVVNVTFENKLKSNISISEISGKVVFSINTSNDINLDLSNLNSGIYFISIKNELGTSVKQVVKQ